MRGHAWDKRRRPPILFHPRDTYTYFIYISMNCVMQPRPGRVCYTGIGHVHGTYTASTTVVDDEALAITELARRLLVRLLVLNRR